MPPQWIESINATTHATHTTEAIIATQLTYFMWERIHVHYVYDRHLCHLGRFNPVLQLKAPTVPCRELDQRGGVVYLGHKCISQKLISQN